MSVPSVHQLFRMDFENTTKPSGSNSNLMEIDSQHQKWLPNNTDSINALLKKLSQSTLDEESQENIQIDGKSIGDVPSTYNIPPVSKTERPVVGTYVHPDIALGFRYWVRKNGTADYLFDGQSLYLEGIGQGYGKRLTFESDDILDNDNFFWSDSNLNEGYAFSINVLGKGDTFDVFSESGHIGTSEVVNVADGQEIMSSRHLEGGTEHVKDVQVNFKCRISTNTTTITSEVAGIVTLKKARSQRRAEIQSITALLLPVGKMVMMVPPSKVS